METINLYGISGHAKVVADIIKAAGNRLGQLYDDTPDGKVLDEKPCGLPDDVRGPLIISIGDNRVRRSLSQRYDVKYGIAVHPGAIVSPGAKVGAGTVVMQGAIVQADAKIGRHVIINTGATVDHECEIGDYVHIAPGVTLCGNVHVGEGTIVGAGTTVIPGVKIGRWCVVGAGSVVLSDIPDGATAYGNPCRVI